MNLDPQSLEILQRASNLLNSGFDTLPEIESVRSTLEWEPTLQLVAKKLANNYPYHHPFYLGQMMKPPHPLSHLAYTLAMCINPNNHALDGGRASSLMEKEAVNQIATMFGWEGALGHLCGGGTIANLEALWVARELTNGKAFAVSQQAHYTHQRCAGLLGVKCLTIETDSRGRMDCQQLEEALQSKEIGTVVVTLGTTGLGAIDPLEEILALQQDYRFRIHVDSAYGGYFRLARNLSDETARHYRLMSAADSIVIDPHKHGLQPYGCGCVLFRDPRSAQVYQHDSPYTYFTSDELHLGEISLECSRAGAAAVALWATLQRFPLETGGDFACNLESARQAALQLHQWLSEHPLFAPLAVPELDIVVWGIPRASATSASAAAREFFHLAARHNLHLALITLPRRLVESHISCIDWDADEITCLRACVMKPEHLEWMSRILNILETVASRLEEPNQQGTGGRLRS